MICTLHVFLKRLSEEEKLGGHVKAGREIQIRKS